MQKNSVTAKQVVLGLGEGPYPEDNIVPPYTNLGSGWTIEFIPTDTGVRVVLCYKGGPVLGGVVPIPKYQSSATMLGDSM